MKWIRQADQSRSEQFTNVNSTLIETECDLPDLSMDQFNICARQYKLVGSSLVELCEHNAQVALSVDKNQVRVL